MYLSSIILFSLLSVTFAYSIPLFPFGDDNADINLKPKDILKRTSADSCPKLAACTALYVEALDLAYGDNTKRNIIVTRNPPTSGTAGAIAAAAAAAVVDCATKLANMAASISVLGINTPNAAAMEQAAKRDC